MKTKIIETDLIKFWKEKAKLYSTSKLNLMDDDTISDYIVSEYKNKFNLSDEEWSKMTRLIIANWFIQQYAFTPLEYRIIEFKEICDVYEERKRINNLSQMDWLNEVLKQL